MLRRMSPFITFSILAILAIIFNTSLYTFKQTFNAWGSLEQPKPPHGEGMILSTILAMKYYGIPPPSVSSINIPDVSKDIIENDIKRQEQQQQQQQEQEHKSEMDRMREESSRSMERMK